MTDKTSPSANQLIGPDIEDTYIQIKSVLAFVGEYGEARARAGEGRHDLSNHDAAWGLFYIMQSCQDALHHAVYEQAMPQILENRAKVWGVSSGK
jgi:hypothetical protein